MTLSQSTLQEYGLDGYENREKSIVMVRTNILDSFHEKVVVGYQMDNTQNEVYLVFNKVIALEPVVRLTYHNKKNKNNNNNILANQGKLKQTKK